LDASGSPVKDSSGNPVKEKVIIRTQDDKQLHYLLGLALYLKKRDLFPGATTNADRLWPAIMLGVALDQTNNYYPGPTWEPITGLDFYTGFQTGTGKTAATRTVCRHYAAHFAGYHANKKLLARRGICGHRFRHQCFSQHFREADGPRE